MKALDPNDQLFLFLDRPHQPMHVAGLQLFELPDDANDDYVRNLVSQARSFNRPVAPFNKRLHSRMGLQLWEYEDEIDMYVHLKHEGLVHPRRIRELLSAVSAKHSIHLDRQRPLWENHIIEGLPGRRFAVYSKVHHAVMDGVSAMRVMIDAFSTDPTARDMTPFWARERKRPVRDVDASLAHYLRTGARHAATVPALLREAVQQVRGARRDDRVSMFGAPHCMLNKDVGGARRVAAQSYSLSRYRAVASACDATLNDVALAVCGSALRDYLLEHGDLPDRPLIALVPMSLRKDDGGTSGNLFAAILANLGTHVSDPLERLELVKRSVGEGKARYQQMTPTQAIDYSALTLAPTALNLVAGVQSEALPYNVVISNVPGPREDLYWNGSRLSGVYPVSVVLDRAALNITFVSYGDSLNYGLVGCRRSLPSMQRMLHYLERGLAGLESALGIQAPTSENFQEIA